MEGSSVTANNKITTNFYGGGPDPIEALREATPETQVRYLMKVVKIKDRKIRDLEVQLATNDLETKLAQDKFDRQLSALAEIEGEVRLRRKQTRIPWWRFIRRWREARNKVQNQPGSAFYK